MIKIARIDGDGIGKEVTEAGVHILNSLDLNIDFIEAEAGRECFDKNGTTIPEETLKIAKKTKAILFGASTSTPGEKSPIITLRQELEVYANLRPVKSFKGVNCLFNDLDFLIVRENTEGLYSREESGDEDKINKIINYLQENKSVTANDISKIIGVEIRRTRVILNEMAENNIIVKEGANKNRKYTLK